MFLNNSFCIQCLRVLNYEVDTSTRSIVW